MDTNNDMIERIDTWLKRIPISFTDLPIYTWNETNDGFACGGTERTAVFDAEAVRSEWEILKKQLSN